MAEKIAVVGSREGASLSNVERFLNWLHVAHPDSIVVSGGAKGVDKFAERTWNKMGHTVWSFRVREIGLERFTVEKWVFGGGKAEILTDPRWPAAKDYVSALLGRDALVAEACDRLVAFMRPGGSRGTLITMGFAEHGYGKPVYNVR